jgi:transposase
MLTDEELERRLYLRPRDSADDPQPVPDGAWIDLKLRRPEVTLALVHLEYLERHPNGYQYTQFCEHYRRWRLRQRLSMRQVYRAGEKLLVDYAGKKPHIVDPATGECIEVEPFVGALGASNYVYAEATFTQRIPDWVGSHVRMLRELGRVPVLVVPDQLKSDVTEPCRYEPGLQRTYEELACHYGTAIVPPRPASPKDKGKVEGAVLIAERRILARLRNETFFSLEALNERIKEPGEELDDRIMRRYGKSRRQLFEELDRPACGRFLGALRPRRVEDGPVWYRLSRGVRSPLLLGPLPAPAAQARGARHRADHRDLSRRSTRRLAPTQLCSGSTHHLSRAHAEVPSRARRVESLASDPLGGDGRPADGRTGRGHSPRSAASGAGLPLLPRHLSPEPPLRQ